MQVGKKTPSLVPLGIYFFFLRLLCFILGLAVCLLLFSFGQVPGLGRPGSGWFAPRSIPALQFGTTGRTRQRLPLAGRWRGGFAGGFAVTAPSPLVSPVSCPWPPAIAASGLSRQPARSGRQTLALQPPSPLRPRSSPRPLRCCG